MHSSGPTETSKYPHGKTGMARLFHTLIYSRDGFLAAVRG